MTISPAAVKELREKTGAGMMDCKKALQEANGDFEAAQDILRKKGQLIAEKKSSREANEGCIAIVNDGNKYGFLKILCETDFVARNEIFDSLMADVSNALLSNSPDKLGDAKIGNTTVNERITEAVTKLGENIVLGEAFIHDAAKDSVCGFYIHTTKKLAAFVEMKAKLTDEAKQVARDICMHISATKVEGISEKDVPAEILEKERAFLIDQAKESGKPMEIIEKMIDGRIKKFKKEICLYDQPFVKDPGVTISELLKDLAKKTGEDAEVIKFYKIAI